ncbi:EAL domain-containing protein [Acidisphaera sp. S103]|uniref:bifunctional diguanylate cyclase/phosphodiesterase n=1 Tax=Acidisphaera sp. S103 TaxID=1747223 RepID=UPI00131DE01D|nr:EAL domain-containing protein [Acidisphaera sp. S103]
MRLLNPRHQADQWAGVIRSGTAILAFSVGVWTTHFIGMLAFRPDMPVSFDVPLCVLSLLLSIAGTALAYAIRPRTPDEKAATIASGLVLAAGIGAMHFVGMRSLIVPGVVHYDPDLVVASLCLGGLCSIAGISLMTRGATVWASVLLALAVASTHFVAMGSVTLELLGRMDVTPLATPRSYLVLAAAGACFLILFMTITASALDRHFSSRLATEARRFRALADATFEGLIFEQDGQIVDANRAMCELAGIDAASMIGRPLSDLIPGLELRSTERESPVEYDMRLPDGQTLSVETLWRSGADSGERVVAIRDISRQKAAERRIERMVRYDPLTGLANRELFEQQLHRALALSDRSAVGVALLYVDLDRFESVNEALGHHATSQILIQTARRLAGTVRETDTVARIGRDEFVIIQSLTEQSTGAAALADRIVSEMALPFSVDDQSVVVTASVGVALYPADGAVPRDLIKNAALAVRQAKHDGRGRWRYFEMGMELLLRTKRSLEHDLRVALKENQLSLNYQPFVDTATLEVVGYEALLRWDHPERGRIPPADFIPIAEECGLIVPIGSWVLTTACAETVSWAQKPIISVNLSPAQFLQPGIVATVADVLKQTGLPPKRLELEITEGTLMADTQNALRILTSLKALGVKLSMDDFGTGYSSLSYLRKFPFDKIKIDRSFVSDLEDDSEAETIVQAIIAMSRSLRLDVTAEGVETKQQLSMLRALGCNFVQGYLLGRPRSAAQLEHQAAKPRWHIIDHDGPRLVTTPAVRSA